MKKTLSTITGHPVVDNQNSKSAGHPGPLLLEDFHLIEKLAHFNRERIPERVVHAKGSGAYGYFRVTQDITQFSAAKLFSHIGKETPIFIRFSTVGGEKGSADTERDPRGFAIKFYTEEGIWDLVGNNTPVFFLRDPLKFPDFIHTQKRDPETNLKSPNMMWDFWSMTPEALHMITILFSDRGIPDGYRFMHGFGSHTFSLINEKGERFWCKWHFKSRQGIKNLDPARAAQLAGENPDYAQEDLFYAIKNKDFPAWRVCLQIMPEHEADNYHLDPFDVTKVWPYKDYPLIEIGEIVLNRNPENYFAEVEQAAFAPSNIVPGLGFSPDRMLQGRLFAYADAQRYRLGINHHQIPVNQAKCPVHTNHRDGYMQMSNAGSRPNYEPSSLASGLIESTAHAEASFTLKGEAKRYDHRQDQDYYSQAGDLFRLMNPAQQALLINNIVNAMKHVDKTIQQRQLVHFYQADKNYGESIEKGLKLFEKISQEADVI